MQLHNASRIGKEETVVKLLGMGANPNWKEEWVREIKS